MTRSVRIGEALVRQSSEDLDQEIPRDMPILNEYVRQHASQKPLSAVTALLIQHQLGNHYPMARALLALGLPPDRLHWLDIPYTANPRVREALQALGIPRRNFRISDYSVLDPYPPHQRRRAQAALVDFLRRPPESLLVLDDGAYFLEALSTVRGRLPRTVIVEQTTRGIIKLEENAALHLCARSIPIVNVARSVPKKTLEPPFIARAVAHALVERLSSVLPFPPKAHCLLLGFGAIGSLVAETLVVLLGLSKGHIHVFDPLTNRRIAARKAGFAPWDRDDFSTRFSLVLGCSGRRSFTVGDFVYLEDGAILASASSGTVELSRQGFIDLADSSELDDIEILREGLDEKDVHSDLRIHLVDREAVFLNGGFPVNVAGQVNCIPTRYMQPTATMMVAGAVQALGISNGGLIDLDRKFCRWLRTEFLEQLGEERSLVA